MANESTRREVLRGGLAFAGLAALGIPEWAIPVLAQDEILVPFTDIPGGKVNTNPGPDRRSLDTQTITGLLTPRDQHFTIQHYGHPTIDAAAFRLRIGGLVDKPQTLSVDDLRKMKSVEVVFGFECSGNRGPVQALSSCGRWTGVPLRDVLARAGVKAQAREFVFFGADRGPEEVEFRGNITKGIEQQFGRSLPRDIALSNEPFIAYAMNGEPLIAAPGIPAAADHPRLVRRGEREMAVRNQRPGGCVPGQVAGAQLPHPQGRDDQRRDEVGRERDQPHAPEVVRGARDEDRRDAQSARRRAARRHARSRASRSGSTMARGSRR